MRKKRTDFFGYCSRRTDAAESGVHTGKVCTLLFTVPDTSRREGEGWAIELSSRS